MKRLMVTVMTLAKASHYRAEARALRQENRRVLAEAADTAVEARMKVERTELALSGLIRELYLTTGGSPLVIKETIERAAKAADIKFASQLADKIVSWAYKAQETPELVKWAKTPAFKWGHVVSIARSRLFALVKKDKVLLSAGDVMRMTEPDTKMSEALSPEEIRAWRRMTKAEREAANKKAADWYASLTD